MGLLFLTGNGVNFVRPSNDSNCDCNNDVNVAALIPAKYEEYGAIYQTVKSLMSQTVKPRVYIVLDPLDFSTIKAAERVCRELGCELLLIEADCKADALNKAVRIIREEWVLIMDVGDVFSSERDLESMLRVTEQGYDIVIPRMKVLNTDRLWRRIYDHELGLWINKVLRVTYSRFGFVPFPGTGLLIKRQVLLETPFPKTLSEDAGLGAMIKAKIAITDSATLLYNLPPRLTQHLKQRARWIAGHLQNMLIVNGLKKKIFFAMITFFHGLTPISLSLMPLTPLHYGMPWFLIDIIAFIITMLYIVYIAIMFRSTLAVLLPAWWYITGLSFYIALYYFTTGKWYHSKKEILKQIPEKQRILKTQTQTPTSKPSQTITT